jgi:hypothetical protein
MSTVYARNRLNWRPSADGSLGLHVDRRATALLHVVKDQTYPAMWRILFPDGSLSDLGNITRVKDAAMHYATMSLNGKLGTKETASEGVCVSPPGAEVTTLADSPANDSMPLTGLSSAA